MSTLPPPPRQPAPDHLAQRIEGELAAEGSHRFRARTVVLPLVAAAMVGVTALAVPQVVARLDPGPTVAGPQPSVTAPVPTASPEPTPHSTTAPAPPPELDVRGLRKSEISADLKTCLKPDPHETTPTPRRGTMRTLFARVQKIGSLAGPLRESHRVLIAADDAGTWTCIDGQQREWSSGGSATAQPTASTPVIATDGGGNSNSCGPTVDRWSTRESNSYRVGSSVVSARVRLVRNSQAGVWQTVRMTGRYAYLQLGADGVDSDTEDLRAQVQFLDGRGRLVGILIPASGGGERVTTVRSRWSSCREMMHRPKPKPVPRPTSDAAGVKTCLKLGRAAADRNDVSFGSAWRSKVTRSSADAWSAVLSDGSRRFGCSLFPTREISAVVPDRETATKSAFFFALNPIAAPEGESLWAAGRVPANVTAISYQLPGGRTAEAKLVDGYWLVHDQVEGSYADGDVADWDPVVVTVTRASEATTYRIPFKESTMCNQVSHGC